MRDAGYEKWECASPAASATCGCSQLGKIGDGIEGFEGFERWAG
jgi:hypothetical protein